MTRIWHQSVNELDRIANYRAAMADHARRVLPDGVAVEIRGLAPGTYGGLSPSEALGDPVAYHRALSQIITLCRTAEAEGFDAFIIGSFSEPFLRECRSAVDIPVISMTEEALLMACSLGRYCGLISNAPKVEWMVRSSIDRHALQSRVIGTAAISPAMDEFDLDEAFAHPDALRARFCQSAEALIARGADAIIPAEGVMASVLIGAGLQRIGKVPVLDVFAIAWCQAAAKARLWERTGLRVGREWTYGRM